MGADEVTGRTSAGHPLRRWKISVPQPGRREVDHMFALYGDMAVKRTSRRFMPMSMVGSASQRASVWVDSERSLCARR
jgi:hypothetical protein